MAKIDKFKLPFEKNTPFLAISTKQAHSGIYKNAVDFLIGYNVPILAAKNGKIIQVKDDSKEGGLEEKFKGNKHQNWITIKHPDGTFSQYVHLAYKSAQVEKGQEVKEGQKISKGIDLIGYTNAPHLHFIVLTKKEKKINSIEIPWKKPLTIYRTKKEIIEELKKPKYKNLIKEINKKK